MSSSPRTSFICKPEQQSRSAPSWSRIHRTLVGNVFIRNSLIWLSLRNSAHAALSPWEGQNALDAAVLAYNNIALLRQQVRPTHRIHGVFRGKDWTPNSSFGVVICFHLLWTREYFFFLIVIPDNAEMQYVLSLRHLTPFLISVGGTCAHRLWLKRRRLSNVSPPAFSKFYYIIVSWAIWQEDYTKSSRARNCMSSKDTGNQARSVWLATEQSARCVLVVLISLRPSKLHRGDELAQIVNSRYGYIDYEYGIANASTDFVSICS